MEPIIGCRNKEDRMSLTQGYWDGYRVLLPNKRKVGFTDLENIGIKHTHQIVI